MAHATAIATHRRHPTLRFELTFPTNWLHANQHTAVLAQSPEKDAVIQITVASEATPAEAARGFSNQRALILSSAFRRRA